MKSIEQIFGGMVERSLRTSAGVTVLTTECVKQRTSVVCVRVGRDGKVVGSSGNGLCECCDFCDEITGKCGTDEFACFGFHVGLLVITLSSLKLHTENNACMLCASVSC